MNTEIKSAYKEYLRQDHSHRSFPLDDQVSATKAILHARGIDVAEEQIKAIPASCWQSVVMKVGLGFFSLAVILRPLELPDSWTPFILALPCLGILAMVVSVLATHFA